MTTKLENVTVNPMANVYFDGKCVSHSIAFADGTKKSVGVILPSKLVFNTGAPEVMELVAGRCRVKLADSDAAVDYAGGQSFDVPGHSSFEIETLEPLHYICHFG